MRITLCEEMRSLSVLSAALGARLQDVTVSEVGGIATNSDEVQKGDLFVALQGRRVHGAAYAAKALQNGATAVLASAEAELPLRCPVLLVQDPEAALLNGAAWRRGCFRGTVIAIGGSAGKTTVKEAVAALAAERFGVSYSQGNYNSAIGLSLSMLSFSPSDVWVLELGINHPGEMAPMAKAVVPHIAVLTNVGSAHIGNYRNAAQLLWEKSRIADGLTTNGRLLIPADLPAHAFACSPDRILRFGQGGDAYLAGITITANGVKGDLYSGERVITNLAWPLAGVGGVATLEVVGTVGILLGLHDDQIRRGLAHAMEKTPRMRRFCVGGRCLIDDAYNASPEATVEALRVLRRMADGAPAVAVLGDMLELGEQSETWHRRVGRVAAEQGLALLITYGERAAVIGQEAILAGVGASGVLHFDVSERHELIEALRRCLPQRAFVLFKGAGKMRLSEIVKEVAQSYE